MIDMHESIPLHHYRSTKNSSSSPTALVASPESLYMNEKPDDVVSDNGNNNGIDTFGKKRLQSSDDVTPKVLYDVSNSLQRNLSSEERQRKGSENRSQEVPEVLQRSNSNLSATSPTQISNAPFLHSTAYDAINGNPTSAIVAMAAGMGLPTMIPTSVIMTPSVPPLMAFHQSQKSRENNGYPEEKNGNSGVTSAQRNIPVNGSGRGIIGSAGGPPRNVMSPTPEERAQYKRPPHTYPALIASAILDSPGNLITLRGIYEYIMNNFPYYKYCHDKSAWQNSIRHNLSLNQCFVKVPRYENAAKSNYWTMTREGFEEFGNENSFKRRRRRGAALAPISAYKTKKYQNEGKNGGKNKSDGKSRPVQNAPQSEEDYVSPLHSQLMGIAASWASGFRPSDATQMKGRKRSLSPASQDGAKQSRMMILHQGNGPSIGDEGKRPNSLTSAEDMQGTLNSFSRNFLEASALSNAAGKGDTTQLIPPTFQSWTPKNIMSSTSLLPSLVDRNRSSPEKSSQSNSVPEDMLKDAANSVMIDGIEVGSEMPLRSEASGLPVSHYRCAFCSYAYVSSSGIVLEQHARMLHQLEMTNAKAKAVAAATMARSQESFVEKTNDANKNLMLQNLMSGLSSASVMAAAQPSPLLAATSVGASGVTYPYSGSFTSGFLSDSIMRSMAERTATSQQSSILAGDRGLSDLESLAYQRQQALNSVLQQAAAAAGSPSLTSQEQLRSFYQQMMLQNPFLANSGVFSRQVPLAEASDSNQIKQQLLQYQQQIFNHMKTLSQDRSSPSFPAAAYSPVTAESQERTSPRKSPSASGEIENELKRNIHGWKQCSSCDFTAKGDHGLELHYRKAHADVSNDVTGIGKSPINKNDESMTGNDLLTYTNKVDQNPDSPLVSSAFPTPPLSNSPACPKPTFVPLDLSGPKEEHEAAFLPTASASTQTAVTDSAGGRTCPHCDIVFGDEMMHALHMSCHDKEDPFMCKVCGLKCHERYFFNVHLLRGLHQNGATGGSPLATDTSTEALPGRRCHSNASAASDFERRQE